ncbi:MAG: UDP-3-O-(3-hydroxymyristoyl)glucosamine N-acyltransferase [Xanthomonadales bacterium]|nr:UDP-3-O-(3-hydroxymyristoyl)glucosamine N-acyltransferase [Xanthomonadales bacterium]
MTEYTLAQLAERFGLPLIGNGDTVITGVGSLERAQPGQLGFVMHARYAAQLASTRASAVILPPALAPGHDGNGLLADNPHAAFARIAALFEPKPAMPAGIHATAVVEDGAVVDPGASVGPFCTVAAGSRIEAGAVLGGHCVIGPDCVIGAGTHLVARVVLVRNVILGKRVTVHPGAVLGGDGFGLAFDQGAWLKVPHLGGVLIGDDCEIGANTTIDRGALDDTVLEHDVRLDNLIQIAHNVYIGAHTAMAGCVGVAGSARIGRHCLVAGAAGIAGHIEICDHVTITAMSMVSHSIHQPGQYSSGMPVQESRRWRRTVARLRRLDSPRRSADHKDEDA